MAETPLTVYQVPLADMGAITPGSLDLTIQSADAGNENSFVCTGKEIVVVQNTGAGARTITFRSNPDSENRKGDITAYSIGAGKFIAVRFPMEGWVNAASLVIIDPEHAELKFLILRYA